MSDSGEPPGNTGVCPGQTRPGGGQEPARVCGPLRLFLPAVARNLTPDRRPGKLESVTEATGPVDCPMCAW